VLQIFDPPLAIQRKEGLSFLSSLSNLPIGFFEGIKKGKPEEATSGFQESSANK
jgi:hypothetical protein